MNDGLWNFPAACFLVPDGFAFDLLQIAVVAVAADEGLHLIQQLLEEHHVSLQAADGAEVIDLFQLKLRLQIFDLGLGSPQLGQKTKIVGIIKERELLRVQEFVRQRDGERHTNTSLFGKISNLQLR